MGKTGAANRRQDSRIVTPNAPATPFVDVPNSDRCDHPILPVVDNAHDNSRKEYRIHLRIKLCDTDISRFAIDIMISDAI